MIVHSGVPLFARDYELGVWTYRFGVATVVVGDQVASVEEVQTGEDHTGDKLRLKGPHQLIRFRTENLSGEDGIAHPDAGADQTDVIFAVFHAGDIDLDGIVGHSDAVLTVGWTFAVIEIEVAPDRFFNVIGVGYVEFDTAGVDGLDLYAGAFGLSNS